MRYTKSEAKDWAKGFYQGLECIMLPSFVPDSMALDEAGIRHDVRELIKHGFFSMALMEYATTPDEDRLFVQWCADEARGRIGVCAPLPYNSLQDNLGMARFAQDVGCDSLLLRYPSIFHPTSQEEVYDYTKTICEATDLAVVLFPSAKNEFPFPGGMPASLLARLAKIENVVAMKMGLSDFSWMDECFRTFGEDALISYPHDDAWAIFIRNYGMQWSGAGLFQVFQTPEDQKAVRLFSLMRDGRMDDAMGLYWEMDVWRKTFQQVHNESIRSVGLYNVQAWKYADELIGMTGGEMREPKLRFTQRDRERIRQAMVASGLKLVK